MRGPAAPRPPTSRADSANGASRAWARGSKVPSFPGYPAMLAAATVLLSSVEKKVRRTAKKSDAMSSPARAAGGAPLHRVAVLINPKMPYTAGLVRQAEAVAPALNLRLILAEWQDHNGLVTTLDQASQKGAQALVIVPNPLNVPHMAQLEDQVARRHLPAIGFDPVDLAGTPFLMAYGPDLVHQYRKAAGYVHRILKGTRPADIPIEQPTRFELAINTRVAKALGLTIPQSLLVQADRLVE